METIKVASYSLSCVTKVVLFEAPTTETFLTRELYESRGGHPGLPVPNKPYGFCVRKATVKRKGARKKENFLTNGVTSYGSGWRKDVINQCLEFVLETCAVTSYGSGWRKDVKQCLEFVLGTCAVTSYGSGWRKDVVKQCLEFVLGTCAVTSYGSVWRKDVFN